MAFLGMRFWLCLGLLQVSSCVHVRAGGSNREVGQQVGANIREANQEIAAEAGQNNGKSAFQAAYSETLTANEMVLVNPEVSKVINKVNRLAGSLVEKDGLCERRWDAKCPDGWALSGNAQCVAPAAYGGACKRVQSFEGKSIGEKQQIAEDCKAPWPCNDDCAEGRDYTELCPQGWKASGGGFCEASEEHNSECATSYDFGEMDVKTKAELAQTCGFNWRCNGACDQDFSKPCPDGWNEVPLNPGMCTAPATYAGACSFGVNTASMTADQRAAFGAKCAVRWPCSGSASNGSGAAATSHNGGFMPDGPVR